MEEQEDGTEKRFGVASADIFSSEGPGKMIGKTVYSTDDEGQFIKSVFPIGKIVTIDDGLVDCIFEVCLRRRGMKEKGRRMYSHKKK
jgi:hypothetical protein